MEWARILASALSSLEQELRLRNEYLLAENRALKAQLKGRLRLADAERARLGEIRQRLRDSDCRPTGHHPDMASKARCAQIRPIARASNSGSPADRQRSRGTYHPHDRGKSLLGL